MPYTRGAEVSRPADRVFSEAVDLVERGVREITLLGQNVNAYHGHPGGLAGLIWQLSEILDLERIRFTTSHPNDMDDALMRVSESSSIPVRRPRSATAHLPDYPWLKRSGRAW